MKCQGSSQSDRGAGRDSEFADNLEEGYAESRGTMLMWVTGSSLPVSPAVSPP